MTIRILTPYLVLSTNYMERFTYVIMRAANTVTEIWHDNEIRQNICANLACGVEMARLWWSHAGMSPVVDALI